MTEPSTPTTYQHGKFDITSILGWMVIIAVHLSLIDPGMISGNNLGDSFAAGMFWLLLIFPASSCVVMLIRRCRAVDGHRFQGMDRVRIVVLVAIYSLLMIMLATIAFEPRWKGSKGWHWAYYTLDGWAGTTLWPIYGLGVVVLIRGLFDRTDRMVRSPWYLIQSVTLTTISFGYVFACLALHFASDSGILGIVPGSVGVCYALLSFILIKNRQFKFSDIPKLGTPFWSWLIGSAALLLAKYPLAKRLYDSLPDDNPNCFIVTAAARGHTPIVKSWYDPHRGKWVNPQLETFWEFESLLQHRFPNFHRRLRHVYNRVGPIMAQCIRNRYVADAIYLLLKPMEWIATLMIRIDEC